MSVDLVFEPLGGFGDFRLSVGHSFGVFAALVLSAVGLLLIDELSEVFEQILNPCLLAFEIAHAVFALQQLQQGFQAADKFALSFDGIAQLATFQQLHDGLHPPAELFFLGRFNGSQQQIGLSGVGLLHVLGHVAKCVLELLVAGLECPLLRVQRNRRLGRLDCFSLLGRLVGGGGFVLGETPQGNRQQAGDGEEGRF